MKRGFLDITYRLFRQNKKLLLEKTSDEDGYYVYKLNGYKFSDVLREIENVDFKKSTSVIVNTQRIKNTDYIIEKSNDGIVVKISKQNIVYELTDIDRVEIFGQLQKYA